MRSSLLLVVTALAVLLIGIWGCAEIAPVHREEVVLEIELASSSGDTVPATITRAKSVEAIPFWVEYEVSGLAEDATVVWMMERPIPQEDPTTQEVEGTSARFVSPSNAWDHTVEIRVTMDDELYRWQEILDFPLHNQTAILLDAFQFGATPEDAVTWSASNGDPDDESTFPIADGASAQAKLVSQWPNVLDVSCQIEEEDGTASEHDTQALIYFKDGTPFETRSVASTQHKPMPAEQLEEILDQEFEQLRSLGVNTITTSINWYFGPPDDDGNWTIHPIWEERDAWPHDPRGDTVLDSDFESLVSRAHEEGFHVHVQLRQWPYKNDPDIEWSRTTFEHTFRTTDEFLYGAGQGYQNMLLYYLDDFVRLGVEFVYLGLENEGVERNGSNEMRSFYRFIIQQYRDAGFLGGISYANSVFGDHFLEWFPRELLVPGASGIPYEAMDAVASTFYPVLFEQPGASTSTLQSQVRTYTDEFFQPRTAAFALPTIIEDCYSFAYGDCAMQPITHGDRPREEECSRRYHNAILREFARANTESDAPWITCMTMAEYKIMADTYVRDFYRDGIVAYPWLNESAGRVPLQLAIKTFFSDKPMGE